MSINAAFAQVGLNERVIWRNLNASCGKTESMYIIVGRRKLLSILVAGLLAALSTPAWADSSVFFERKTKGGWLVNGGFDDNNVACYATDLKLVVIETFSTDDTFTVLFDRPRAIRGNGKLALIFWSNKGVARTYWTDYEVIDRRRVKTVRLKLDIRKFAPIFGEHAKLTVSFDGDNKTVEFSLKGIRDGFLLIRDCIGVALNLYKLRARH